VERSSKEVFSPIAKASQLSAAAVSEFLREGFENWGLPKAVRVDNGSPWATQSDIPSALALWLVGLGVKVLLNRPRHCTDNAIVERGHGVLAKWVEPQRAYDCQTLQAQLDWAIDMQRQRYPAFKGKSRLAVFPDLLKVTRSYAREEEKEHWQLQRVLDYLIPRLWQRRVDKAGQISFFSHAYSVGKAYVGKTVTIHLDAQNQEWLIESEQGKILKRYSSQELSSERIFSFSLSKRANKVSHDMV
jgi:hypothetical protein